MATLSVEANSSNSQEKAVAFELMMTRPKEGRLVLLRHQDMDLKCRRQIEVFSFERELQVRQAARESRFMTERQKRYASRLREIRRERLDMASQALSQHQLQAASAQEIEEDEVKPLPVASSKLEVIPERKPKQSEKDDSVFVTQLTSDSYVGSEMQLQQIANRNIRTAPSGFRRTNSLPAIPRRQQTVASLQSRIQSFLHKTHPGEENNSNSRAKEFSGRQESVSEFPKPPPATKRNELAIRVREMREATNKAWETINSGAFDVEKLRQATLAVKKARFQEDKARRRSFAPTLAAQKASKVFMKSLAARKSAKGEESTTESIYSLSPGVHRPLVSH